MWLSYLLIGVIAAAFVSIIVVGVINKKKGKSSCSCGGNCGACGLCNSQNKENNQ
ncbi:MAG: FeoB-associated Cys-rich membrane protein [Clostridia bacterium]|nr:FeoB-associated Cys-rich membrane protein [Clostridia bacterium]